MPQPPDAPGVWGWPAPESPPTAEADQTPQYTGRWAPLTADTTLPGPGGTIGSPSAPTEDAARSNYYEHLGRELEQRQALVAAVESAARPSVQPNMETQ